MSDFYKKADDVLIPVLEKIGMNKSDKDNKINEKWSDITGMRISKYSSFYKIDKRTLYINTDDSHYIPLILAQKKRIIEKYNSIFPSDDIRYIKVIVNSI